MIIHIDMDCFYAAVEMRDDPMLRQEPVAVGGSGNRRGVLCTCNYEARKYGVHSAMPIFQAMERCPHLIIRPVHMGQYQRESTRVRAIFKSYTDKVEPLSLDEAYLDVSHLKSEASEIALEIRQKILTATGLTASAGIAPNKMLAKIASDWNKPDGQFEIRPEKIDVFMQTLPIGKIWGIGRKTRERLNKNGIETCGQLQKRSIQGLSQILGKFGAELYGLCRGQDNRDVVTDRIRKSLSVERTFSQNLSDQAACLEKVEELWDELQEALKRYQGKAPIAKAFVKLRFSDFTITTLERSGIEISSNAYKRLVSKAFARNENSVRLIGLGMRFLVEKERNSDQLLMNLS